MHNYRFTKMLIGLVFLGDIATTYIFSEKIITLEWLPFENQQSPVYEAKVPISDGYSTI